MGHRLAQRATAGSAPVAKGLEVPPFQSLRVPPGNRINASPMNRLAPITPGELLQEEFLKPLGISHVRLAKAIDVPASRISEIISGRRAITADTDLLITVTDDWLAVHNRFEVLDRLRWHLNEPRRPVDLLLFSRSQVEQRRQLRSSVVHQAYTQGRRLDG